MASTAGVTPASSVGAANVPDANQANGAGKSTMKTGNTNSKTSDGRRQSPVDGSQKRVSTQKAWTSGHPLTQRSAPSAQANGITPPMRSGNSTKASAKKEVGMSEKHAHDRFTFIMGAAYGSIVTVTTKAGDQFEGVLSACSLQATETKITLRMTTKQSGLHTGQTNGIVTKEAALIGSSPEHAMSFDQRDIADISIAELSQPEATKSQNSISTGFQTDSDISRSQNRAERKLEKWVPDTNDDIDLSLESSGNTDWDQFETNKTMFGTGSTYDENDYTTPLDRNAPTYKQREAEAARIAREIEGANSSNSHMREERGQALEVDGDDEEDKYSGVRRTERNFPPLKSGTPNMYTPPARRAPTGQPTVQGAPVDPAIISAQLSRQDNAKVAVPKPVPKFEAPIEGEAHSKIPPSDTMGNVAPAISKTEASPAVSATKSLAPPEDQDGNEKLRSVDTSVSPQRKAIPENPTEDVENKVLDQFRQFATSEKLKHAERRRLQATHDRAAKLNDLKRFSTTFKLKTPVPTDLVGILAKDPQKQEQIIEKAQREHKESIFAAASPASTSEAKPTKAAPTTNAPLLADRPGSGRGRGGFTTNPSRTLQPQQQAPPFQGRGMPNLFPQRPNGPPQERKQMPLPPTPAPIPIHEGRMPPTGPMADQSGLSSPQRSSVHTPTSATSIKLNVKAMEFKPNANAPAFNPSGIAETPTSPVVSVQPPQSASRSASPSAFFGARKPKSASERPSISEFFNPIKRMKEEAQKEKDSHKNYSSNGGIPHAYQTGPRWTVKEANADKTYTYAFEKQPTPAPSPAQSRSSSTHHVSYQNQMPAHIQNGQHMMPQISTPHRTPSHPQNYHYQHQTDESHGRIPMPIPSPQIYSSPHVQMIPSPMNHPAQLAYPTNMPGYYGQANQGPMQMRPYPGTPQYMHTPGGQLAAPMMVQQQSSGPYMSIPQQYNPQIPMYSPSPAHVYPQQNGFPSPGRAQMMMHQNSQQGHHTQPAMYAMPSPAGQMMYPQQGGQMGGMRSYTGQPGSYGSSPHQPHNYTQRAMSNGYGQMSHKTMHQQGMPGGHGMPPTGPQQHGGYAPIDVVGEEAK